MKPRSCPPAEKAVDLEQLGKRFDSMCDEVRTWTLQICRNVIRIAEHLCRMKPIYEAMTGTGWGKRRRSEDIRSFDEEVARRTGVDPSLIRRYCRVGQLDAESRHRIEGNLELEGNLTLLYRLVRLEVETRHRALEAYDRDGRRGLDLVLGEADGSRAERSGRVRESGPRRTLRRDLAIISRPAPGAIADPQSGDAADAVGGLVHTFESPPPGDWVEHRLDAVWALRINVVLAADGVASVSVQLVPFASRAAP